MIVLGFIALAYSTWLFFLAIMALKMARDEGKLSQVALCLGYPMLVVGLVLDFSLNMASTVIFLELPQELLLTYRCDRLIHSKPGWRQNLARWLCQNLLDPFQIGGHCH